MTEATLPVLDRTSPPAVLTIEELADLLQVSETTVKRMNLPAIECGRGRWRYVTTQVLDELARRAKNGGVGIARGVTR